MICSSFRVAMQLATATCSWPQHFAGYFLPACTPSGGWGVPRSCAPTESSCPLKCRPAYYRVYPAMKRSAPRRQRAWLSVRLDSSPRGSLSPLGPCPLCPAAGTGRVARHGRCLIFFTASTMAGGCCLLLPQIKKERKKKRNRSRAWASRILLGLVTFIGNKY